MIKLGVLTLGHIGKWPCWFKWVILLFISILLQSWGYFLLVKGDMEHLAILKSQEMSLRRRFELKQSQSVDVEVFRKKIKNLNVEFKNIAKLSVKKRQMPGLLDKIAKTALKSGLSVVFFSPLPEVEHGFYIQLPIAISVMGNYQQLINFLSRLMQMQQLVTWQDFIITKSTTDDSGELLLMKITVQIYRYQIV